MSEINCHCCNNKKKLNLSDRLFNSDIHYFLCDICKKNKNKIISIKKLKQTYHSFSQSISLQKKKIIYQKNKKDYSKHYLIEDFKLVKNISDEKKMMDEREKVLKKEFYENKLKLIKTQEVMSFIKYGTPSLDNVILSVIKIEINRSDNQNMLINKLNKLSINYDIDLPTFKLYTKGYDKRDINEIINDIEVEYILYKKTKYIKYRKIMNDQDAQEKAMLEYFSDNNITFDETSKFNELFK